MSLVLVLPTACSPDPSDHVSTNSESLEEQLNVDKAAASESNSIERTDNFRFVCKRAVDGNDVEQSSAGSPGTVFGPIGNFRPLQQIKNTLFGQIFRGVCINTGAEVALKVSSLRHLKRSHVGDDPRNEAKLMRTIESKMKSSGMVPIATQLPFIRILDELCLWDPQNDSEPMYHVLVMEYVKGGDLFEKVHSPNKLKESELRKPLFELCRFIHFLHTEVGVCHLDISLENVLMDLSHSDEFTLKLCDFGLARPLPRDEDGNILPFPAHATVSSKRAYTAPELCSGKEYRGDLADVFSLGMTLLFSVTASDLFGCLTNKTTILNSKLFGEFVEANPKNFLKLLRLNGTDQLLSREFAHLILSMICWERQGRLSMAQVLDHRFFTAGGLTWRT